MKDLQRYLLELYPTKASKMGKELQQLIRGVKPVKTDYLNQLWYKNINLYVVYPDMVKSGKKKPFASLTDLLPKVSELGCNAIHILPFLASPMLDKGFDVSDFTRVRPEIGNLHDVKRFKTAADKAGIRVFMDLVFNHVSEEHEWFKKAQAGDEKYRNYFIHAQEKPQFIRTFHQDAAVWAEYEIDGQKKSVNVAFPEHAGEIPHWREGTDGYWYYHTYYPEQIDVNWQNADVFMEFARILIYWASLGFNFRLDAIPFVGKSAYKEVDGDNEKTFAITAAYKALANEIYPEAVFIVETYESLPTVIKYFGDANRNQAELSYNFHLCTHLWVGLIEKDAKRIWETLKAMQRIPHRSEWLNFLRNHDELSLAYLDDKTSKRVSSEILKRGASFREGHGVSGRSYSLLGNNEARFLMAYFLLLSMPGGIAILYGDEIGRKNVPLSELSEKEKRDTRNINRGILKMRDYQQPKAQRIFNKIKELLHQRNTIFIQYTNANLRRLDVKDSEIFATEYVVGSSRLMIIINLSRKKKKLSLALSDFQIIGHVNHATVDNENLSLGPYGGIWLQR